MAEAERILTGERTPAGTDQPLPDERLQDRRRPLILGRCQIGDRAPPEHLPITAARWRTERSSGSSRSRRAASTAWTVSGTRIDSTSVTASSVRRAPRAPFLDEHAQHLLEEERIAAGRTADGVGGVLVERPTQILEQLPRIVALQRGQLDRGAGPTPAGFPRCRPRRDSR